MQPLEIVRDPRQVLLGPVAQHHDMVGLGLAPAARLVARAGDDDARILILRAGNRLGKGR